jgi:hypothetical protein
MEKSSMKENVLQRGRASVKDRAMTSCAEALANLGPTDGVLLVVFSGDEVKVTVAAGGILTESRLERNLPIVYQEVLRQRMALARQAEQERIKEHERNADADDNDNDD